MATRATTSLASVVNGTPIPLDVNTKYNTAYQVSGTFVGTWVLEGTLDNIFDSSVTPVWSQIATATAAAFSEIYRPLTAVRFNCTAYTSGTIVGKILQGD